MQFKIPKTYMGVPIKGAMERLFAEEEKKRQEAKEQQQKQQILPSSNAFFITKELYDEYEKRRKKDFPDIEALNKLNYNPETNEITGSNPFIACYVNKILPENYRTATQADLEKILKDNSLSLEGHYEDSALVLRSEDNQNSYLTKNLIRQLGKIKLPVMIPLYGLEIAKDNSSHHKLVFNLTDNSELIYAPILNENSASFSSEDVDENGLPKKLGKGNRCFYTRKTGLSGAYLGSSLSFYSSNNFLANSDLVGRVVIVNGEAARKILGG